jgi:hypothetical protein
MNMVGAAMKGMMRRLPTAKLTISAAITLGNSERDQHAH